MPSWAWYVILSVVLAGADVFGADPWKRRAAVERMQPEILAATQKRVRALEGLRLARPIPAGLNDYKGIFHAHAEDATHTGGTRPEMLADAIKGGVKVIFLSDHYRPPRDFITGSWRGLKEGVLFIPGSEIRGFLIHPTNSIMTHMDKPVSEFVRVVGQGEGLIFLSHMEERPDHSMEGLNGMEIYNRHYDAKRDLATLVNLALRLTDPKEARTLAQAVRDYPDEMLASQVQYSADYFDKWDRESVVQRVVGVAANDCHHNQVFIVKKVDDRSVRVGTIVDKEEDMRVVTTTLRPGLAEMIQGKKPGDIVIRVDFDPYYRSFRNVSTHIFAASLDERTIRAAVREGHVYVSHDWMADPTGFWYGANWKAEASGELTALGMMGDVVRLRPGLELGVQFALPCHVRWMRDGKVVAESVGDRARLSVKELGVYRVEAWLEVAGEMRPWIYSNPIYIRTETRTGPL